MKDLRKDIGWLLSEKYLGIETAGFKRDLERLKSGVPLAYLIGHVPFLDAIIHLDSEPLIPRTETEFWVEKAINELRSRPEKELVILDLCAGSGCIGISALLALENAIVDFVEIDETHHKTIRKNLFENNIDINRATIRGGDVYSQVTGSYDCILTNPPYIDKTLDRTDASVIEHEPHNALFADEHGLSIIAKIIEGAPQHLQQNGIVYLEHEPEQTAAVMKYAAEAGLTAAVASDQYGMERFTRMCRKERDLVSQ